MAPNDDVKWKEFLKRGIEPADGELRRDLWQMMLRRMEQTERGVPWFDWALLGALVASLAFVPRIIPMLLYHL